MITNLLAVYAIVSIFMIGFLAALGTGLSGLTGRAKLFLFLGMALLWPLSTMALFVIVFELTRREG